jgi:F-type H+-transporting ATPase subunit delta
MAETKVARRYAKSLLDLGKERNITALLYDDMMLVASTIDENRALKVMLKSPVINTDKKDAVLKELFGGKINEASLEFMRIITRKKREYYIEDIAKSFIDLYKVYKNIQPAYVITAVSMDDKLRNEMLDLVKKETGSEIELQEIVDPSIIGGYILRWGDRQIDASVTSKLSMLKQDFRKNLYIKDF